MERLSAKSDTSPNVLWLTQGWPSKELPNAGAFHCDTVNELKKSLDSITIASPLPWIPTPLTGVSKRWKTLHSIPEFQQDNEISIHRPRFLTTPRENHLFISHYTQQFSISPIIDTLKPQLIHAHFAYASGTTALWIKRKKNIPYVLSLHGDDVTIYPHRSKRALKLFRATLKGASRVLAVSSSLAEEAKSLSGTSVDVLPNGLNLSNFSLDETKAQSRERLDLPLDASITVFVGNLTQDKGIKDIQVSLKKLGWKNRLSIFIGEGPEKENLARDPLNLCTGAIPHKEITRWLHAADYFLLPSYHEGLGQAAVEAGAVGLPVIGGNVGGLKDLLQNERGILIQPGDTDAISQALQRLKDHPDYAKNISTKLKKHVLEKHNSKVCAQSLHKIYLDTLTQA